MGIFSSQKPVPALWFIQGPARAGVRPQQEGPFTRAVVLELWYRGDLAGDVLVWTNEKLFPSPDRHSNKLVRIEEWRRWVELPDPVRRRLEEEAVAAAQALEGGAAPKEEEAAAGGDEIYDPFSAATMSVGAPSQPPDSGYSGDGGYGDSNKIY
jgi:hypothetical protein